LVWALSTGEPATVAVVVCPNLTTRVGEFHAMAAAPDAVEALSRLSAGSWHELHAPDSKVRRGN
jgi:hypothetical protein